MLEHFNRPGLLPAPSLAWACSCKAISHSCSSEPLPGLAGLLPKARTTRFPQDLRSGDLTPSNALHPPLCFSTEPHFPS